jgi:hypothetical protein
MRYPVQVQVFQITSGAHCLVRKLYSSPTAKLLISTGKEVLRGEFTEDCQDWPGKASHDCTYPTGVG